MSSGKMKIVADGNIPFVKECFSSIGEVKILGGAEINAEAVSDADVLLVRSVTKVDEALIGKSKIKFVATATIGYDHVDLDYLKSRGIGFASAPGSNSNSVAEYIVAAILEVADKYEIELEGRSIGIIGVGNVGSKVEKKCRAMGMRVLLNDPPLYRKTGDAKYRPLDELYKCDFITIHTPLTLEGADKTFHLANREFFNSLKQDCIFINSSRGRVVDTEALKDAIRRGKLWAGVLDVWENEPTIDIELLDMVDIATPHIAGYSFDGKVAGMIMIYRAVCEHFGLKAEYNESTFLPKPIVSMIEIRSGEEDWQNTVLEAVRKVYDISADDARLRDMLRVLAENRGKHFTNLRKNYPVRREFHNTEVRIRDDDMMLAKKLEGIGFKVPV